MTFKFSRDEQAAIKAAWATDHGRAALTVVIDQLCMLRRSSFNPDPHITALNEGRRFVGIALMDAINKPLEDTHAGNDGTVIPTATERAARSAAERATGRKSRARK